MAVSLVCLYVLFDIPKTVDWEGPARHIRFNDTRIGVLDCMSLDCNKRKWVYRTVRSSKRYQMLNNILHDLPLFVSVVGSCRWH